MTKARDDAESPGIRHLRALAVAPRAAGSSAESDARRYAAGVLRAAGFDVREEPFPYSAFPGRFGTPIAGAILGTTLVVTDLLALAAARETVIVTSLLAGVTTCALFSFAMMRDGVLDIPWLRATAVNLVATRAVEPRVWLTAHLDTKSQPVPSLVRVGGVMALVCAALIALAGTGLTLAGTPVRTVWWASLALAVAGLIPVTASVVGNRSDGALDNASGTAAVLAAAARLGGRDSVGVLITSAEELGLAGARAWTKNRPAAIALNCDGVDDEGSLNLMYNGVVPRLLSDAVGAASPVPIRVRRMPLGLLTDSTAFTARGWTSATLSHGSLKTLARIHRPSDSLKNLRGDAIDGVADILARSAEALS